MQKSLQTFRKCKQLLLYCIVFSVLLSSVMIGLSASQVTLSAAEEEQSASVLTSEADTHHVLTNIDGFRYNQLDLYSIYALVRQITPYGRYDYLQAGSSEHVQLGSITQFMTYYVAMKYYREQGKKWDRIIRVREEDRQKAVHASLNLLGLHEGDELSIKDLLHAMLLHASGEAIYALVREATGNEKTFVQMMNSSADDLGMKNTHYINPVGFPDESENSFTTLEDTAILMEELMNDAHFLQVMRNKSYKTGPCASSPEGFEFTSIVENYASNRNLDTSSIEAGKTGATEKSAYSYASFNIVGKSIFLTLTARAKEKGTELADHLKLRQRMKELPYKYTLIAEGELLGKIPLMKEGKLLGQQNVLAPESVEVAIPIWSDLGSFASRIELNEELEVKEESSVQVGSLHIVSSLKDIDFTNKNIPLKIELDSKLNKASITDSSITNNTKDTETTSEGTKSTVEAKANQNDKNTSSNNWLRTGITVLLILLVLCLLVFFVMRRKKKEQERKRRLRAIESRYRKRH